MRVVGSGLILLAVLAMVSAASANVVVNGDFEAGVYATDSLANTPQGWHSFGYTGDATKTRVLKGDALGVSGNCVRLRLVTAASGSATILYQEIPTTVGETYSFSAQWKVAGNGNQGWIGAFFFDNDGTNVQDQIKALVPGFSGAYPHRHDPNVTDDPLTDVLASDQDIVAERAPDYGMPVLDWESIYDAARDSENNQTMTPIGVSGNGAAWQSKVAGQTSMIVGFFMLDSWNGAGTGEDLYIDNVAVELVPEPAALVLLAVGMLPMLRRRR